MKLSSMMCMAGLCTIAAVSGSFRARPGCIENSVVNQSGNRRSGIHYGSAAALWMSGSDH